MKFYTTTANVKFSWEQVSTAFWKRYPNPWSKHVLTEDVINRSLDGPVLRSKRIFTKTNRLPRWGEKFVSNTTACIVEESVVNSKEKTLTTLTRNISYQTLMVVEEKVEYTVNKDNKDWTQCKREARVMSGVYGFARAIEAFGVERYKQNINKSRKGLEFILEKMYLPEKIPTMIPTLPLPQTMCEGRP